VGAARFADLVARTEWLAAKPSGRVTMSPHHQHIDSLEYNKYLQDAVNTDVPYFQKYYRKQAREMDVESWKRRKTRFTKLRCTYQSGAAVYLLRDYNGEDIGINDVGREGRRILWADNVINQLVEYITPPDGQTKVTDERHKTLYQMLVWYDKARDPERLKAKMEVLISGTGGDDPAKNFRRDRGIGVLNPFSLPKTARLIQRLLEDYRRIG
jgi:hypothetical protein